MGFFDITSLFVVQACVQRQFRHPDDRVHRRTDLVTHVGKELRFNLTRLLRLFLGPAHRLFGLYLFADVPYRGIDELPVVDDHLDGGDPGMIGRPVLARVYPLQVARDFVLRGGNFLKRFDGGQIFIPIQNVQTLHLFVVVAQQHLDLIAVLVEAPVDGRHDEHTVG